MNVYTYETSGEKDLIREYLDQLPKRESAEGYLILQLLEEEGVDFFTIFKYKTIRRQAMGDKVLQAKPNYVCIG